MSAPNRAALLTKTHKILKKHYKPAQPAELPLVEQLAFACCLENSRYEAAEAAFRSFKETYFDWNEVRVTTVAELAEVMHDLHNARDQAWRLRRTLQSVFETTYSFDLEALKKKTIGQAVKELEKLEGVSPFAVAWAVQTALGGHSIPIDRGAAEALRIIGAASPQEAAAGSIPGLERAIPKSKGVEFGSLLHQLGADLLARPFGSEVRGLFVAIHPDAKARLPKRSAKKSAEAAPSNGQTSAPSQAEPAPPRKAAKPAAKKAPAKSQAGSRSKAAAKPKPR